MNIRSLPKIKNVVIVLSIAVFIQFLGAMAVSPILPIFLKHNSQKESSVGLIIALFFVFNLISQYPSGRYLDKHNPISVIIFGLTLFSVSSILMGLSTNFIELMIFRSLQGIASGSYLVSTNSIIAKSQTSTTKTKAFAYLFGSQVSGTTIGALLGSTFGLNHLRLVFVGAAILSLFSLIYTLLNLSLISHTISQSKVSQSKVSQSKVEAFGSKGDLKTSETISFKRLLARPEIQSAVLWAAASGSVTGVYETLWSPFFLSRGANGLLLGLSWFCFGAPYLLFSWKIDSLAKLLKLPTMAISQPLFGGLFIIVYVSIHNTYLIVGLCAVEALAVLPGAPAIQTILTKSIPSSQQGQLQGIFLSSQIAFQAIAAFMSGIIATVSIGLSFYIAGSFSLVICFPIFFKLRKKEYSP